MKALPALAILAALPLVGCAADKSSDVQTVSTPPAKSQVPGGAPNVPPQAQKAMSGGK